MKKYFLCLIFLCGNAMAQPTSVAGITPGKTTIEELSGLVDVDGIISKKLSEGANYTRIRSMNRRSATLMILNGVVYKVDISLAYEDNANFIDALIEKYGRPGNVLGSIDKVICQNKMGAKFERYQGLKREMWPENSGVQALIQWRADECDYSASPSYILYHSKTVNEMELKKNQEDARIRDEKMNKIKEAL